MAMQLILTASDLAAMPMALKQDLLAYLATRRKGSPPGTSRRRGEAESEKLAGLAVLDSGQAIALIRNVSFGHRLKGLHDLLEALSYEKDGDAPGPDRLTRMLEVDELGAFAALLRRDQAPSQAGDARCCTIGTVFTPERDLPSAPGHPGEPA